MNEFLTTQQLLQLLASMIGGGLAGSTVTILYNRWATRRAADERQRGTISALTGEMRRSRLLCSHNSKYRGDVIASFIHFPTTVAIKATFEDRHSFPLLARLQSELEGYTLGIIQVNELMDLYRHLFLWSDINHAPHHYNRLRDQIADVCDGKVKLEGIGPENAIVLPSFIDHLLQQLENLQAAQPQLPAPGSVLPPKLA